MLTSKSPETWLVAEAKIAELNAVPSAVIAYKNSVVYFLRAGQFSGWYLFSVSQRVARKFASSGFVRIVGALEIDNCLRTRLLVTERMREGKPRPRGSYSLNETASS